MKALQFIGAGKPLTPKDIPAPTPEPGWVVIDVHAAGLCHSDVHILRRPEATWVFKTPIVLGHEVAGTIAALGEGVTGFDIGDRVGIALISHPFGEGLSFAPGLAVDGGYAEQTLAHASTLVRIPDNVSFAQAAVATDSVATAYHAVRSTAQVVPGQNVGIIGMGGLGLNGVRVAALQGATVYGVDINTSMFEAAGQLGAAECFTDIADLKALQPDVVIDFAGAGATTAAAVEAVRPGGRVVVIGLEAGSAEINIPHMVLLSIQLHGSLGASKQDLVEVYDLIAAGELQPRIEGVAFDDVPAALDRLHRGEVTGRLVTNPQERLS
ncbi:molecular chaperone GroES [Mycobacterium nebraskense]|uniref:arabinose dehydrogenase n=1 Tax=Mycobacterium nebraskense TaxID=244292 RepID=UPI0006420227|nr:arabinose dehydrogenase [Mycobacterium nebraskense]KLO39323.1 molecular chaperone GroES [Mycobacterium nebraskense]